MLGESAPGERFLCFNGRAPMPANLIIPKVYIELINSRQSAKASW